MVTRCLRPLAIDVEVCKVDHPTARVSFVICGHTRLTFEIHNSWGITREGGDIGESIMGKVGKILLL